MEDDILMFYIEKMCRIDPIALKGISGCCRHMKNARSVPFKIHL
jgi:hypothetical protein